MLKRLAVVVALMVLSDSEWLPRQHVILTNVSAYMNQATEAIHFSSSGFSNFAVLNPGSFAL